MNEKISSNADNIVRNAVLMKLAITKKASQDEPQNQAIITTNINYTKTFSPFKKN